jgi:probable phosphoglycerate mutase
MPVVMLIRHGENEYVKKGKLAGRLPGVHLNEKGREQAEKLAEALAKQPVKAIYSSPLERTLETAEPIAKALDLKVVKRKGLLELDFGKWEDKSLKVLATRKLWRTVQGAPSRMRFPEGESFAEAQNRIVNEIDELCSMHKPREMFICVGHSDMIKLAVAYFVGMPLDQFQRLVVSPASVTTLHIGKNGSSLINLNHHPSPPPKDK